MEFDNWFYETEVFSLRCERFYDDLVDYKGDNPEIIIEWLKAAYEVGRQHEAQKHWEENLKKRKYGKPIER